MAIVIPVAQQPEPQEFDAAVRKPGLAALARLGWQAPGDAVPPSDQWKAVWRACLPQLHLAYGGICAYACTYVERVTGAGSVDHFVAKSAGPKDAYEWTNYRLACAKMNSRKRDFSDVLDPFTLADGTFTLNLLDMAIAPSAALPPADLSAAADTIRRLSLDDAECRDMRASLWDEYIQGHVDADFLRRKSPFVFGEARRQGRLKPGD